MVDQEIIDLTDDSGEEFDTDQFVPMQITPGQTKKRTWADIFSNVPGVSPQVFTWAASDEDSSLITGILYITEAAIVAQTFTQVIISVKNTPTSTGISVDILEESGTPNTFTTSIFSTPPIIAINKFTSEDSGSTSGVLTGGTFSWTANRRLQIKLITNDDPNFATTGLKVTLR